MSDSRLRPKRPHLLDFRPASCQTVVQPVGPHVGGLLNVVRIGRLGHDERSAVGTDGEAAGTSTAVGGGRQSVAQEPTSRRRELEDAVRVGVGHQDVAAGSTVDRHAVRTLELALSERVTCATSSLSASTVRAPSEVERIDPLRFVAGCRKRRLNQAPSVLYISLFECVCCAISYGQFFTLNYFMLFVCSTSY